MRNVLFFSLVAACTLPAWVSAQTANTPSDPGDPPVRFDDNRTPTYAQVNAVLSELAHAHAELHWMAIGYGDSGKPIYAAVLASGSGSKLTSPEDLAAFLAAHPKHMRLLVTNAIHPGEPCGVDASVDWIRALLNDPEERRLLDGLVVAVVPHYNNDGALVRTTCSRANQDGPEYYGFRGNARNLDLNRDFTKMDSRNSFAFVRLFQAMDPDVFIDTHTTNGADYTYPMTLITTQPDKAGQLGWFLRDVVEPTLYGAMEAQGFPMSPYVSTRGETPESGIIGFLETPRYSTGYAALFGTIGFVSEAHMLKPFPERVAATRAFLGITGRWMVEEAAAIRKVREDASKSIRFASELPLRWELDATDSVPLPFKGYVAEHLPSAVTGSPRLRYNREEVWRGEVPYFNRYTPVAWSRVPEAYWIPGAWREVIERIAAQGIPMYRLPADSTALLEVTYIDGFTSPARPYEGHHMNRVDSLHRTVQEVALYAGDVRISTDGPWKRYLVETLEPEAHDSFFVWNFFDSMLQQKEGYSGYVFEDTAAELLERDVALRAAFERARAEHPEWATDGDAALRWVYRHSPYMEASANRYPVYRTPAQR
jgi:hypothetical protein